MPDRKVGAYMWWYRVALRYRKKLTLVAHFLIFVTAYWLAYLLRFDFVIPAAALVTAYQSFPLLVCVQLFSIGLFGMFRGLWSYVSLGDIVRLLQANVVAAVLFLVSGAVLRFERFPRSILILDAMLAFGLSAGLRLGLKMIKESLRQRLRRPSRPTQPRILIVGAGDAGVMLFNELRGNPGGGCVVGFIDDDSLKQHATIHGKRVLGLCPDIPRVVFDFGIEEIIVAIPSAGGVAIRRILGYCEQTAAAIKVIPGLMQILNGKMELQPRDVQPEDLLGRETVEINTDDIQRYIQDRVVLVTGGGGSIGSEICRQAASFGPRELVVFDHGENSAYFLLLELQRLYPQVAVQVVIGDIQDVGMLKRTFSRYRPAVVFHTAAHKHVPLMEACPIAAVKNNIFGTQNVIYASHHYGVERFVLISTDKAVNPVNVMGSSKRIAELMLQARASSSKTKFMAVRFGNVLGSAGSVVPLFKMQIAAGGPVTVTHPDVMRYFMSIKEAVMLVLQAGALGSGGELFVLDMGQQVKVVDIAKNLIALSGLTLGTDIQLLFTGLRPGEKLSEELLLDKEKILVTTHNKIFIYAGQAVITSAELSRELRRLRGLVRTMSQDDVAVLIGKIVEMGG